MLMSQPVLFDTDMGVDDAVALTLLLCADELRAVAITTVGGNVSAAQAAVNVGRCLGALRPATWPPVSRGHDQTDTSLSDAAHIFGADGLGDSRLPAPPDWTPAHGLAPYADAIAAHPGELIVVAVGPLTNLAALLDENPAALSRVARIVVMGGAVFRPGNVTPHAEFNIYRDPDAAARVFAAGLPITLVPLDVTATVALDESHVAHLAASHTRSGEMLARMIEYPMGRSVDVPPGRFLVHDAVAVGVLLWPELFLQTQMALHVAVDGEQRGRTAPAIGRKDVPRVSVILSVQAAELLERMLERLCDEKFVV